MTANANAVRDEKLARALAAYQTGDPAAAERICSEILVADPRHAKALLLLGVCAHRRQQHERAVGCFDRSLDVEPDAFQAHYNRALALKALDRPAEAIEGLNRAIGLNPRFAGAFCNRANVLRRMNRLDEAIADYDRAIALDSWLVEAHNNRGAALQARGDLNEALRSYDSAVAANPRYAQARINRGLLLLSLRQLEPALADLDAAMRLGAAEPYVLGHWLQIKKDLCDWSGLEPVIERALAGIAKGERVALPFNLLALPCTTAAQSEAARIFVADRHRTNREPLWQCPERRHDRIRIGYVSPDFHDHATSYLLAEVIERHDRTRFEIVGFSTGPDDGSPMRARLHRAFDAFHDVRESPDYAITQLLREQKIDIAVDLVGHAGHSRTEIFAPRAAPIQVNYLGYPGSMGTEFIDYVIADPIVVPLEQRPLYAESVVHLPHTYQANDATKEIGATPTREEERLPNSGFVFCCFNNAFKLSRDVFEIWMRLLSRTDGSVLWLLESHPQMAHNLRAEAQQLGVDPGRLVFAERAPLPAHLARHTLADLFLDTFHYNAHTTASDALWTGLPVLTCIGETFASRVAASLLTAIGLPELIAPTRQAYEATALELAHDAASLARIRATLRRNRSTHPLFDTPRFVRHLECAYVRMWKRYRDGLPPAYIRIDDEHLQWDSSQPRADCSHSDARCFHV